ncbi:hypothetical protein [Streptomyces sp. NPDC059850]|uniref:hypothetical protein n=1 Tax=Streptomyces sp. NPDC059850 TaxID=3346970 RepID=UPI003662E469
MGSLKVVPIAGAGSWSPRTTCSRRRADAQRSRTAVLDAAIQLLGGDPDAGMAATDATDALHSGLLRLLAP